MTKHFWNLDFEYWILFGICFLEFKISNKKTPPVTT
jgi:hypothetical protein